MFHTLWGVLLLDCLILATVFIGWALKAGALKLNEKALYKQRAFILAIFFPFIFASLFGTPLVIEYFGKWQFNEQGYKNFVEIFAFPVLVMSLSLVFGVMVARFHLSKQREISIELAQKSQEQTEESLSLTRQNNNYTLYIKHREEFENRIKLWEECDCGFSYGNDDEHKMAFKYNFLSDRLYRFIFPNSKIHSFKPLISQNEYMLIHNKISEDIGCLRNISFCSHLELNSRTTRFGLQLSDVSFDGKMIKGERHQIGATLAPSFAKELESKIINIIYRFCEPYRESFHNQKIN